MIFDVIFFSSFHRAFILILEVGSIVCLCVETVRSGQLVWVALLKGAGDAEGGMFAAGLESADAWARCSQPS